MHAYLVIGKDNKASEEKVVSLAKDLGAKLVEFEFGKISDVREIAKFTSLNRPEKFAILLKSIEKASLEALNAFLKNLEEPQSSISYILTSSSLNSVLPTIVSRCQVIRLKEESQDKKTANDMLTFIKMGTVEKLNFLGEIRERGEAVEFLEKLITAAHQMLLADKKDTTQLVSVVEGADIARLRIVGNGNVGLQLISFAISLN